MYALIFLCFFFLLSLAWSESQLKRTLTSSDEISNAVLPLSVIIGVLMLCAFVSVHLCTFIVFHGYLSLGKTSGPTTKQLAVRCYSKCYCTASGVNVLARRLRLASNRYIVCDNANKKVCQYVNHLMKYQEKINVKFCSLLSCRTDKNVFF